MKKWFVVLLVLVSARSYSQVDVNKETIKDHIGDSVKYCGKVVSAIVMERMSKAPAFLNIDGAHPNQVFTVVIWKPERELFTNKPEKFYVDKNVCVYGRPEKYREQLQIVIRSESQIVVQE